MKVKIVVKGGGYDGATSFKEIPDDSCFKTIESIGIPVEGGAIANFPTLSISRKKIVLDGEKLWWEMRMKRIPIYFKGGEYEGKRHIFESEDEVDIYTLKGGSLTLHMGDEGDKEFPILDISRSGILLDGANPKEKK